MKLKTTAAVFLVAWAAATAHAGQVVDVGFYRFECVGRPLVINDSELLPESDLVVVEPITDLFPFVTLNGRPLGTLQSTRCQYDFQGPDGEFIDLVWHIEVDIWATGSPHGEIAIDSRLLSDGFEG